MLESIQNSERLTFKMSGSQPSINTNVILDTSNDDYVVAASGATDQVIGAISRVEASGTSSLWFVTVAVVGPVKVMDCTGTTAPGDRLVPNGSGLLITQAVNLSGTAFKHSPGICLQTNASGAAKLRVLQNSTYIPV